MSFCQSVSCVTILWTRATNSWMDDACKYQPVLISISSILLTAMWCSGLACCSRRSNGDVRLDRALITSQSWTQLYRAPSSFAHEGLTWMGSTAPIGSRGVNA